MKLTFPHILAYLVGALVSLAALNPATVTALVGPSLGHYAVAGIALAGALVAFIHSIWPSAIPATAVGSKQGGFITRTGLVFLASAALSVAMLIAGCASIESFISSPTGAAIVQASVDVAVATAEAKGVPASQINKVAKAALAADTGVSGTLAAISSLVDVQIANAGLPAADLAAAKILEVAISASITAKVGSNANLAAAQAAVADILNEVIAATGG
jgi:uncharacterized protein YceK